MKSTDMRTIKAFLLEQKSAILNKTVEFKSENISARERLTEEAEAASLDVSLSLSIQLHERDRALLFQIDRALSRIEAGEYGECASCGDEISPLRLQARPFTHLCVQCKEDQEDPRNYLN